MKFIILNRPMYMSKIEIFPNRVASGCSAKLLFASPASGVDISKLKVTDTKQLRPLPG